MLAQDPDFKCPKCGEVIDLDETLAGPIISKIKTEASEAVRKATTDADAKVAEANNLRSILAAKQRELAEKEASIQTQVNQAIALERQKIATVERENILKELSPEIEAERAKAKELQDKLTAAQTSELELRQEKADVDQRAKNLELEVARKIDEQRKVIQEQASKETAEAIELKVAEHDKTIAQLQEDAIAKSTLASTLEASLALKEKELAEKETSIQTQVNQALASERQKIVATERENILKELSPEIEAEKARTKELQDKLTAAQTAELQLRQEKDAVDQKIRELDLEVARRVDSQRKSIEEKASEAAQESARLDLAAKDKIISDMNIKLEEAQRKATQGSQQLQGDILEIDFESNLRLSFPQDTIEPIKTGTRGGDILQRVMGEMGQSVGTIFWETKRAQSWGGDWTTKAKQDAAEAKAEVAMIVSDVLPKGLHDFGSYDGVWCVKQSHALMLGFAIRQGVISTAEARQGAEGRESKEQRLYSYMSGPEFRSTLEGIALPFRELHEELLAEKRSTMSRWKRQERRIERVLLNVSSFQGDLVGIAGAEMPQLPGFQLESGEDNIED